MLLRPGTSIVVGGKHARECWYTEIVGLTGKVQVPKNGDSHIGSFKGVPCYYVLLQGPGQGRATTWYVAQEDCLPSYIGENSEAVGMLREEDPYV